VSQENVEIVRGAYTVPFGGEEWLAKVQEIVDPECEIEDRTLPEVAPGLRGPTAARAVAAQMLGAFDDVDYTVQDLVDLDDRVLVRVRGSGRGKGSGIRIDGILGHLWTLRAGRVVRLDVYATWQEAVEAAEQQE
jgi:ketosteroid isomerase-like protein